MKREVFAYVVGGVAGVILFLALEAVRPASAQRPELAVSQAVTAAAAGAQVYAKWDVAVADGKTATTAAFNPGTADADENPSATIRMGSYTGVVLRARYADSATMDPDPVVYVWGLKGTTWTGLADVDGDASITLSDADATDCTDGTYLWTLPSKAIDALGCEAIRVTVQTAAVSDGAVRIEATLY